MRDIERAASEQDRLDAIAWAKDVLADPRALILDSETTGLEPPVDFVEIAIVDMAGTTLFQSLLSPHCEITPQAQAIHGHSEKDLEAMPSFDALHRMLHHILTPRRVIVYNARYDRMVYREACDYYLFYDNLPRWECAMKNYAAFVGETSSRGGYRFQRLPGGDHSAVGDCLATLAVIREIAAGEPPRGSETPLPIIAGDGS